MSDAGDGPQNWGRDPLLTPQEVVELLQHRITTKTLSNWRSEGEGSGPKFKKLGNRIYYLRSAVLTWMEREFDSARDYKAMREERRRIAPTPAPAPAPVAPPPPPSPGEELLAEFDAHIADVRKLLVARLAGLAVGMPMKRPRGRPRGSKNKGPRRSPSRGPVE